MPSVDVGAVREALLGWYDRAARALPWRGSRDPYAIWVSEISISQLTRKAIAAVEGEETAAAAGRSKARAPKGLRAR
jgi:hypothetical protein